MVCCVVFILFFCNSFLLFFILINLFFFIYFIFKSLRQYIVLNHSRNIILMSVLKHDRSGRISASHQAAPPVSTLWRIHCGISSMLVRDVVCSGRLLPSRTSGFFSRHEFTPCFLSLWANRTMLTVP